MDSTTLKMYHGILCTLRLQGIRFPTTVTKKADNTKSYVANLTFVTSDDKKVQLSFFDDQISKFKVLTLTKFTKSIIPI
ncbi:hypothetical protein L596_020797 [Steinernema carpocapsae]|uniref:Uncharacterized protein n=1 Tax=Steinernema carpocapsae TaxID=34508 RepID=A0A4U5MV89_STECR|nr:hypothetical protein L596_020797 [Steinernema carpocapsae]